MKTLVLLALLGITASAVVKIPITRLPSPNASKIIQEAFGWSTIGFLGNITVGTPPQQFTVLLDTSSSGFWIPDVTDSDEKKTFNSELSSTYQKNGSSFSTSFDDNDGTKQDVSGFLGVDTLAFGAVGSSVVVANVTFGQATSSLNLRHEYDGVLGLRPTVSSGEITSPFIQAVNQGVFSEAIITAYLSPPSEMSAGVGVLTLGGLDADHCSDDVIYTDLTNSQFTVSNAYAGNFTSQQSYEVVAAALNEYLPYLYVPTELRNSILAQTGGQDAAGIVVSSLDSVPDIVLTVSGKNVTISKENFAFPFGDSYVLPIYDGGNKFILQNNFICSYCTVYDYGKQRIGFAKVKK